MYLFSPWTSGQGHELQGTGKGVKCQSEGVGVTLPGICWGWSQGNDGCLSKACGYKLKSSGQPAVWGCLDTFGCWGTGMEKMLSWVQVDVGFCQVRKSKEEGAKD